VRDLPRRLCASCKGGMREKNEMRGRGREQNGEEGVSFRGRQGPSSRMGRGTRQPFQRRLTGRRIGKIEKQGTQASSGWSLGRGLFIFGFLRLRTKIELEEKGDRKRKSTSPLSRGFSYTTSILSEARGKVGRIPSQPEPGVG